MYHFNIYLTEAGVIHEARYVYAIWSTFTIFRLDIYICPFLIKLMHVDFYKAYTT